MADFMEEAAVKNVASIKPSDDWSNTSIGAMLYLLEHNKRLDVIEAVLRTRLILSDEQFIMAAACRYKNRDMYTCCLKMGMAPVIGTVIEAAHPDDMEFYDYVVSTSQFSVDEMDAELRRAASPEFLEIYNKRST